MEICKTLDCAATAFRYYEISSYGYRMITQSRVWSKIVRNEAAEDDEPVLESPKRVNRFDPAKGINGELLLKLKILEGSDVAWEKDQYYETDVPHKITRKEAEKSLSTIIHQLKELDIPDDSLVKHPILPKLKVLTPENKRLILFWLRTSKPEQFTLWNHEVDEDLKEFRWVEKIQRNLTDTWTECRGT